MEKKPSWDDIGSIKLEMDDGTSEDNSGERRSSGRLTSKDIKNMLHEQVNVIQVQVATHNGVLPLKGVLLNIHEKGMCFSMPGHGLKKGDAIMVATLLGKRILKTKAIVRWRKDEKVGVEFIDPDENDANFLKDLLSAKVLNYRI